MRRTWETRLKGCQRNVEVWQRMLRLRAIVMAPSENLHMWIKFANLCRKSGRVGLAEKSLKQLIGTEQKLEGMIPYWDNQTAPREVLNRIPPQVTYAILKYEWEIGQQPGHRTSGTAEKTLYCLQRFSNDLAIRL